MHHSHHRPHVNGRGPDYTALEVDDQMHQNPSRTNFKKEKTWCVKDVCGIFCAVLTWFLILYAEFVVLKVILVSDNYLVASFFYYYLLFWKYFDFFSAPLLWNYLLHSKYSFISSNKYFGIFFSCENNAHRPWCSKYLIIICIST